MLPLYGLSLHGNQVSDSADGVNVVNVVNDKHFIKNSLRINLSNKTVIMHCVRISFGPFGYKQLIICI